MKKKKKKIIWFIIILIIICITLSVVILKPFNKNSEKFIDKLVEMGYSPSEAKKIDEVVSIFNQDLILNTEANDSMVDILTSENFDEVNLENYLDYFENNKNAPINDIVSIVNSGYDVLEMEYTPLLASLIKEKYFIYDYLERYMEYSIGNDYSASEIVTNVNSNLDKVQYEDISKSDTKDDNLVLVNKYYYLESDYEPTDLVTLTSTYNKGTNNQMRRDAANAFMKMADAALLDNIVIKNVSGYRSYKYQKNLYDKYVARDGIKAADTYSARAGHSEHQSGLATDVNLVSSSFENTAEFKWLEKHCFEYGFILRYPKGKEHITGYKYEPWHYRYVGKDAAMVIKDEGLTFEEYYAYYVLPEKDEH